MAKKKKMLYDIELFDTKSQRILKRGQEFGRYPLAAIRRFSKKVPKINLKEMRDAEHARYVFLAGKAKKKNNPHPAGVVPVSEPSVQLPRRVRRR